MAARTTLSVASLALLLFLVSFFRVFHPSIVLSDVLKAAKNGVTVIVGRNISSPKEPATTQREESTLSVRNSTVIAAQLASLNCSYPQSHLSFQNYTGVSIWIPAYPGSGSEMFRSLVSAATGTERTGTGEIYSKNCQRNPTCKTHWPVLYPKRDRPRRFGFQEFSRRFITLVRNPKDALHSFFNYAYEQRHRKNPHSEQGKEKEWEEWRDENFDKRIKDWASLFRLWRDEPNMTNVFYLKYEDFTSFERGPQLFQRVVDEMKRNGALVAESEDVPCLWYKAVKGNSMTKRPPRAYEPGYTRRQREEFLAMLRGLMQGLGNSDPELTGILTHYYQDISHNLRVVEEKNSTLET